MNDDTPSPTEVYVCMGRVGVYAVFASAEDADERLGVGGVTHVERWHVHPSTRSPAETGQETN